MSSQLFSGVEPFGEPVAQARQLAKVAAQALLLILQALIAPAVTTTQVILRRQLGERYFTGWNLFAGAGLIVSAAPLSLLTRRYIDVSDFIYVGLPMVAWLGAFLYFGVTHFADVRRRYKDGNAWHSRCSGVSRWEFALPRQLPMMAVEIAGVMLIGIICCFIGLLGFGILLIVSGHMAWLSWSISSMEFKTKILDSIDSQLESENLAAAIVERRKPKDTAGFEAPVPAYIPQAFRERFVHGVAMESRQSQSRLLASELPGVQS